MYAIKLENATQFDIAGLESYVNHLSPRLATSSKTYHLSSSPRVHKNHSNNYTTYYILCPEHFCVER